MPNWRAPVADVVVPDHRWPGEVQHPRDRVPHDRGAQVTDVHLLGDVGRGVFDHHGLRLGRGAGPSRGSARIRVAWAAIQSSRSRRLMNPGPLTSGGSQCRPRRAAGQLARRPRAAGGPAAWPAAGPRWPGSRRTRTAGSAGRRRRSPGRTTRRWRRGPGARETAADRPWFKRIGGGTARVTPRGAARLAGGAGSAGPLTGPAGAEPLGDLLGDLAAGQVGGEQAGRGDRAGRAGAVRDDHCPAQAEQDGAAVALRVQPGGQLAQAAALQEGADPRGPVSRSPRPAARPRRTGSSPPASSARRSR